MKRKLTLTEELSRYNDINKYQRNLVLEQNSTDPLQDPTAQPGNLPPTPGETPPLEGSELPTDMGGGTLPTADMSGTTAEDSPELPADTLGEPEADDTTEEIDITDLVNMTKSIKKDLESKQDDSGVTQKMDDIFSKLTDLETKLNSMDELISKIDNLEVEVKNSKPKSPEEKLEMRSLDSYPFNKNPQEFFDEKLQQMKQSGKNEYILTKNDIENYSKNDITKTFNPEEDDEEDEYQTNY